MVIFRLFKLFLGPIKALIAFGMGAAFVLWLKPDSPPYDFRHFNGAGYELMFTQQLRSLVPMDEHLVEIYYKKNSQDARPAFWKRVASVYRDPFDLDELQIERRGVGLEIRFPFGGHLTTSDFKVWKAKGSESKVSPDRP